MAGYWETYMYYDAKYGESYERRRWVTTPDPKSSTGGKSVPKPPVLTSAQIAAKRAAAQKVAQRQAAIRRSKMYARLGETAKAIRGQLAPKSVKNKKNGAILSELLSDAKKKSSTSIVNSASSSMQARAQWWANKSKRDAQLAAIKAAKAGDAAAALKLEQWVREARDGQIKNPDSLDRDMIVAIDEAYNAHIKKVSATFAGLVDKLKGLYVLDKNGNLVKPKNEQAAKQASVLYDSPDFQMWQKEYIRLNGADGKQGSIYDWVKYRDAIAVAQREKLWKNAQNLIFKSIDDGRNEDAKSASAQKNLLLDPNLAEMYKKTIDPTKTSTYLRVNGDTGKLESHTRTVEEEFQYQKGKYIAELQRQYGEFKNQQIGQQARARSLFAELNSADSRVDRKFAQDAQQAMLDSGITDEGDLRASGKLEVVIKTAVSNWVRDNLKSFLSPRQISLLDQDGRPRVLTSEYALSSSPEYQRFLKARAEAEKRFYVMFNSEKPGFLDTVMETPAGGVLNVLGAGMGAIGAGAKVGMSVLTGKPGEFLLAGRNYGVDDLPPQVRRQINDEASRLASDPSFIGRVQSGFRKKLSKSDIYDQALAQALESVGKPWLGNTEDGRNWANSKNLFEGGAGFTHGRNASDAARIQDSLKTFTQQFYEQGGKGDLGAIIKGLSEYGSLPFTPDSSLANLIAGIGLDPTNAIPLKATTWWKRVQYAMETTQDAGLIRKATLGTINFLKVTEPELRFETKFKAALKEINSGVDPTTVVENMKMELMKIKEPTTQVSRAKEMLKKAGIDPLTPSGRQLYTFVEENLVDMLHKANVDYQDVASQVKKMEDVRIATEAVEKAKAAGDIDAADARLIEREKSVKSAVESQRAEAVAARNAEVAKLAQRVADEKGYKGLAIERIDQSKIGPAGRGGREVGAQYDKVTGKIRIDEAVLQRKFAEKSWTKPADIGGGHRVAALPADAFPTYESFKKFAMEHEYQHSVHPRFTNEPLRVYEQRINELALTGKRAAPIPADIQKAYDAGDVAAGQALNREVAFARGGTRVSGGAVKFPGPIFKSKTDVDELMTGVNEARLRLTDENGVFHPILDQSMVTPTTRAAEVDLMNSLTAAVFKMRDLPWSATVERDIAAAVDIVRQISNGPELLVKLSDSLGRDLQALRAASPPSPVASAIRDARVSMAQKALEIASKMTEEEWLTRELQRARAALKVAPHDAREAALRRVKVADRSLKYVTLEKAGHTHVSWNERDRFVRRVTSVVGRQASETFSPKIISPYASSEAGAEIEQARQLHRRFLTAERDETGGVAYSREASDTYRLNGVHLEKILDQPAFQKQLVQIGIHPDVASRLTLLDILSNIDEFVASLESGNFAGFFDDMKIHVNKEIRRLTGDDSYGIEQFLEDRLLYKGTHYDARLFEQHDKLMAGAISRARGWTSDTLTSLRRKINKAPVDPVAEVLDRDLRVVIAKARVAKKYGIDVHAYNEARKVLRRPMVQKRKAQALSRAATAAGGDYTERFLFLRKQAADTEARTLLGQLAGGEMFGQPISKIIDEFNARYAMDGDVRPVVEDRLTSFQYWTLEDGVKQFSGVDDIYDEQKMAAALSSHGQAPPFGDRSKMREWLEKHGVWSPRTTQQIEAGKMSWSLEDEARYYWTNYAQIPDWANPALLEDGASLSLMRHDEEFFMRQQREWGVFNRNMDARFATAKLTREERAHLIARGDPLLKIEAKRDLALERRYVMERYGRLAVDDQGNLIAFPWLMKDGEYRTYLGSRMRESLASDLVQSTEQLDVAQGLIKKYMDKYLDIQKLRAKTVTYEDLFSMSTEIVADLLRHPLWLSRKRDKIGTFARRQAHARRLLVFSMIGFASTNIVDSFIKEGIQRYGAGPMRKFLPSPKALAYESMDFGMDRGTQLLRDTPVAGTARIRAATGLPEKLVGVMEIPAEVAGKTENAAKLRIARHMYDEAFERGLAKAHKSGLTGQAAEDLADVVARKFAGEEATRLWPTVGDGPIERFFNYLSPFASYQLKNRVLFISEGLAHPAIFNYLDKIGDYVEQDNRARWAKENPGVPFDESKARYIQLPWTHGKDAVYFDLGVLSDASRGFAPIYDLNKSGMTYRDFAARFIRLAGAGDINIVGGILNAMGVPMKYGWKPIYDAKGFPTGRYERVAEPWMAPWGVTADARNSFWPWELFQKFESFAKTGKGLTVGEITQLAGQMFILGGIKPYNKIAGIQTEYFLLKSKDPEAARAFLLTLDGKLLLAHWQERTFDFTAPQDVVDLLDPPKAVNLWWTKTEEWRSAVTEGRAGLKALMAKWDNSIWSLTPGTEEYKAAKLSAQTERYQWYSTHPELVESDALFKTPSEWAQLFEDWKTDSEVDTFFNLFNSPPKREDFKTTAAFLAAQKSYDASKLEYLRAHPNVVGDIGRTRNSLEKIWSDTEDRWFDILDSIGSRKLALEAAKQANNYDLADQLYLITDLQFSQLDEDTVVSYFDPTTDYKKLTAFDKERELSPQKIAVDLLSRVKVLPDFNKWNYDRLDMAGKAKFESDQKYANGMSGIVAKAKASGNFGLTFVKELKKNPWLLNQYFLNNPGKREQWAATDAYIGLISKYGILAKQGKFAEAGRYFDSLPDWVKARYYEKHPDRRAKAQQNLQYMNWMKKWVSHYSKRDYAGGAAFFNSMPDWVKARYRQKHPGYSPKAGGSSAYSKAMGTWVGLLKANKDEEARMFFASMPKAFKDRYYAKHPDAQLRDDVVRTGQLGQYFAADDAGRAQYLKDNPEFTKWLNKNMGDDRDRSRLIMAAYRALPKDDAWLRRVFREKYPEVFSAEAKGEQSLKKTYAFLAQHPNMLPSFERWSAAVWASYADSQKHRLAQPRPIEWDHSRQRQHGLDKDRPHRGKSAAWVRLHTVG